MRRFTHKVLLTINKLHTNIYNFLGPAPSETKW